MMTGTLSLCFQSPLGAPVFAFLNVVMEYTSCLVVGCVLDCAKVMPSFAIEDSGTVQFLDVAIVGPQGGVEPLELVQHFFREAPTSLKLCFL